MNFTNNPYEKMMKQKPRPLAPSIPKAPKGSRCSGCPYWRGISCVSCYRELLKPLPGGDGVARELTREEKRKIRALVVKWCANYNKEYGCLPLECECYMFGKCWTGAYCRYFREAVLPLDPALEAALLTEGPPPVFKPCPICGGAVPVDGRMAYCSEVCARIALRRQKREYMRKKRR